MTWQPIEIEPGVWAARRYCTRMAYHLYAFERAPSDEVSRKFWVDFPGVKITGTLQEVRDRINSTRPIVWA